MTIMTRIIVLTGISITMTFASTQNTFKSMSTIELQKKVEQLSKQGKLPFEMGLELIKRWKHL